MAVLVGGGIFAGVSFAQTPDFKTRYALNRFKQSAWDLLNPDIIGLGTRAGPNTPLYFYTVDQAIAPGSSHGTLTERAIAKSTVGVTGWSIGINTGYALMQYNATASVWAVPAQPASAPTTSDCYRSENKYTGTFAAGTWSFSLGIEAQALSGATIAVRFRIWRSSDPTGQTGITELTSGAVATPSAVTQSSPTSYATSVSLGAASLSGEYLFLQIALQSLGPGATSEDAEVMQNAQTASIADLITPVFSSGVVTSNGTLAVTLGAMTASATTTVGIAASETSTLDLLTLSSAGTVASSGVNGTLSVTLGTLTVAATGAVAIAATAATTLGALTASATGSVAIAGTATPTLGALTSAATATVAIAGAESSTLGVLTSSTTGTVAIAGTEASTLGAATTAGTGIIAIAASEASTLALLTASSSGSVAIAAAAADTLGVLTASGASAVAVSGTASPTLGAVTSNNTGVLAIAASEVSTLGVLASAATGALAIAATEASTLGALSVASTGTTTNNSSGVAAIALDATTAAATGSSAIAGASVAMLGTIASVATGALDVATTGAVPVLSPMTVVAVGVNGTIAPTDSGGGAFFVSSWPLVRPQKDKDQTNGAARIQLDAMSCVSDGATARRQDAVAVPGTSIIIEHRSAYGSFSCALSPLKATAMIETSPRQRRFPLSKRSTRADLASKTSRYRRNSGNE